ncbi:MAG TPA: anti-sigma factor [Gemmatimonadaceae bacterium]|nr:anti-sigma factor [Gemmatimonadaceae bacterium]
MTSESMTTPDLTCKEMVELVTDYLEGALSPEMRTRFDHHLTFCDPCIVYIDQIRQTIATLGRLPEESIPDNALDTLRAHFREWRSTPQSPE